MPHELSRHLRVRPCTAVNAQNAISLAWRAIEQALPVVLRETGCAQIARGFLSSERVLGREGRSTIMALHAVYNALAEFEQTAKDANQHDKAQLLEIALLATDHASFALMLARDALSFDDDPQSARTLTRVSVERSCECFEQLARIAPEQAGFILQRTINDIFAQTPVRLSVVS